MHSNASEVPHGSPLLVTSNLMVAQDFFALIIFHSLTKHSGQCFHLALGWVPWYGRLPVSVTLSGFIPIFLMSLSLSCSPLLCWSWSRPWSCTLSNLSSLDLLIYPQSIHLLIYRSIDLSIYRSLGISLFICLLISLSLVQSLTSIFFGWVTGLYPFLLGLPISVGQMKKVWRLPTKEINMQVLQLGTIPVSPVTTSILSHFVAMSSGTWFIHLDDVINDVIMTS
jgi:hypothetical protein